jgi:acyl-CoA synthetase (AMP-forming)/AMP-acid ligase II
MKLLLSAVSHYAAVAADRIALRVRRDGEWTVISYGELNQLTLAWAAFFYDLGCAPGSVIFIVLKHRAEMYSAFLGAMRAGLVPSFLPFPTPKQDGPSFWSSHAILFARVRPVCILTYGPNVAIIRDILGEDACHVLDIEALALPKTAPGIPLAQVEAETNIALLQHSSGTTGLKKGVILTYGQIRAQISAYATSIGADADSRIVSWLPVYHDMGLITSFIMPMTLGAEVISIDAFDWLARPDMLLTLIGEYRATHCWLPNFAFNHLIRTRDRKRQYDLSSLRALVSCSEPAKPETMQRFAETFDAHGLPPYALQVCYAMAEAVFGVTQTAPQKTPRVLAVDPVALLERKQLAPAGEEHTAPLRFLSCGKPVGDIHVRIDAEPGTNVGEIILEGSFLFSGYYLNQEATDAAITGTTFRTGDLGFMDNGELFICGRLKELLIIHGRNYYATDIEEAASSVPGVKPGRTVAFSVFDPVTASEAAILLAEAEPGSEVAHQALQKSIRNAVFDRFELALKSVEILSVGEIIKTTSGKNSRKDNRERYISGETRGRT